MKIFEEWESDEIGEPIDYNCDCCENIFETEIRLLVHIWHDHGGKSTLVQHQETHPHSFNEYCISQLENGKSLCRE